MAPIVLFVFNRPQHTQRTLAALAQSKGAELVTLCIFSDAPRSPKDNEAVAEVRKICRQAKGFAQVKIVERQENFGLARNIIEGVTEIFNHSDEVVVLEDDLITSPHFIHYINDALTFYKDKKVFSVAGYSPNIALPSDYNRSTYFIPRNCSWGWATWKDRWQRVDWQVSDFEAFIRSRERRESFNIAGNDLTPMLLKQRLGQINSWSIRFCYAAFAIGWPTVYPVHSQVRNGGIDGSGTHMKKTTKYDTVISSFTDSSLFAEVVEIDDKILRAFRKFYNTSPLRQVINWLKIWRYNLSRQ